jgi:Cu/Ag efflux protein CusF
MRRIILSGIIAAAMIAVAADRAAAHHSFSAFEMTSQKTVAGTIKEVDWTNPHIWIWMNVTNDKGGLDTYGFEGMSPNFLARRGWTKSTMKAGDKVSIVYRPMRDGSNGGMFLSTKLPDGTVLTGQGAQPEQQ